MGMTAADPSKLDPETAAKLGLKQVGQIGDIKKKRKQYKHGNQALKLFPLSCPVLLSVAVPQSRN